MQLSDNFCLCRVSKIGTLSWLASGRARTEWHNQLQYKHFQTHAATDEAGTCLADSFASQYFSATGWGRYAIAAAGKADAVAVVNARGTFKGVTES